MSKVKLTPLAQALKVVDVLNEADKATLRDYLRPERQARPKSSNAAPPAPRRSSRKGAQAESTVSLPTDGVGAGTALSATGGD